MGTYVDSRDDGDSIATGQFYQTRSHRQEHRHDYARGAGVCRQNCRNKGCPEADSGRACNRRHNLYKEVKTTGFIHNVDKYGYTANHHNNGPRHNFYSSFGITITGEHQNDGKYEGNRTNVRKHVGKHFRQGTFNTRQARNNYQKNQNSYDSKSGALCSVERFRFRSQFVDVKRSAFLFFQPFSTAHYQEAYYGYEALSNGGFEVYHPCKCVKVSSRDTEFRSYFSDDAVGDDAGRSKRRECSRVAGTYNKQGHQECRHSNFACDSHSNRGHQSAACDVARSDSSQEVGK